MWVFLLEKEKLTIATQKKTKIASTTKLLARSAEQIDNVKSEIAFYKKQM